jgi:hypothetical protein
MTSIVYVTKDTVLVEEQTADVDYTIHGRYDGDIHVSDYTDEEIPMLEMQQDDDHIFMGRDMARALRDVLDRILRDDEENMEPEPEDCDQAAVAVDEYFLKLCGYPRWAR